MGTGSSPLTAASSRLARRNIWDGPTASKRRGDWGGPDVVAVVLAVGLALVASLILLGTIVQILHGNPEVTLSENATQVLVGATGGLVGVLGGYMGFTAAGGRRGRDDDDADGPGA
jgi:hypothetical protein